MRFITVGTARLYFLLQGVSTRVFAGICRECWKDKKCNCALAERELKFQGTMRAFKNQAVDSIRQRRI
ncbi:MAG: hypothetical protein WCS94_14355, partial [Verrucomicrobiota bacterium]